LRRDLIRLALLGLCGVVVLVAYTTARIWEQGARDEQRPADAIVVLGAAQLNGRPSSVFKARLEHAVSLYQAGLAPFLIVTGGKADGDWTTEAAVARAFAIEHGVPAKAILVEDRGRTTLESMRTVGAMMRTRRLRSAVFVSDRTHLLRVLRMARDQALTGWGSPTMTSPTDTDPELRVDATIHEVAALGAYFLGGVGGPELRSRVGQ
jgi:uncharacterized SAM-binding protein YcdF (DUF218 family)